MSFEWDEVLSDNGIMMEEGEAAKALALGISEKTALSGGTTSVDVSGMCSSLFAPIGWGYCDAVDQVISVIAPRFVDGNNSAYSSDIGELITVAGFTTAVYGATNGEVRLQGGGMLFDSKWIEQRKSILNLFVNAGTPVVDAVFTTTSLDSNAWTVTGSTISGATTTLPDSVNAIGSTATPTSYYRGPVTYTTNVTLDSSKRYYLYLNSLYQRADVVLGGHTVTSLEVYGGTSTEHTYTVERPGIPTVIDLTSVPFANGGNTLTVKTDNTKTYVNVPFNGLLNIYNMLGGVTLCEAGKLCFDPVTFGTRRCHLTPSASSIGVAVAVKNNSNQSGDAGGIIYADVYLDGSTTSLASAIVPILVSPGATETYTFSFHGTDLLTALRSSANKWGIGSGKQFKVILKLDSDTSEGYPDTIEEYCGYRTFSVSKHNSLDGGYGLTLSGSTTSLYGVTYHHWDRVPTTAELDSDWAIITALKPKMIRFAYFPALHYLLDKCDQAGIVAMLEIPWMHDFHSNELPPDNHEAYRNAWRLRYQHNVTANAVAMINEFYNHPSVLFYTIGTGFGVRAYEMYFATQAHTFITEELLPAVRAADSSRLVCLEQAGNTEAAWTDAFDILLERMNSGWGSGSISGAIDEADAWNGKNSTLPVGFIDWSYWANPADHVEWSGASTKPSDTGYSNDVPYPEEYQAYCVEQYSGSALALKWPVFNLYGSVFDYAASGVTAAGGKSGIVQAGLVTRDRSIFKDAYYYLKAMWNDEPMVHVTQKRNANKEESPVTLRIYTNCNYVKVYSSSMTLLDTIQRTSGSYVVTKSVELEEGSNIFYATGHSTSSGESTCSDNVTLNYEDTSSTTRIQIYSDSAIVNAGYLDAAVLPSTEPQGVSWSSDTPTVATINSGGTVTVISDGTASFRATSTSDNTVTKVKSVPCFVRGDTQGLYYQAALTATCQNTTKNGISMTDNHDGTFTLDGTVNWITNSNVFHLLPANQVGNNATRANSTIANVMVPPWGIPGDQIVTAEVVGGTITGTTTGAPMTVMPLDKDYHDITLCQLYPMNKVGEVGDVKAKLITGSTLGFAGFVVMLNYTAGTVLDNVVLKVNTFKLFSDTYNNAGILESHCDSANTVKMFVPAGDPGDQRFCNMYARNADGSFTLTVGNPNSGWGLPGFIRLTDTFTTSDTGVPLSGATIAETGDVLRFTVVMVNWPGNYVQKDTNSKFSFVVRYADGTEAAELKWAYQDNGDGVDFTGGTASTTFIAEKTVDHVGLRVARVAWGGPLDGTETILFRMKMELLDPTEVPPSSVTVYGSTRITNTGQLNHVCSPLSSNQSVTWSSSNTSVATVDSNGKVTVVGDGSCTFTATSTLDNTKSDSIAVSCLKITTDNMAANIAAAVDANKSIVLSGVTVTNKGDGTFELDGTVASTASVGYHLCPLATNGNTTYSFFLPIEISGDVLVWFEHLGGTVSDSSTFTGKDFEVRVYGASNTVLDDYTLNYKEYPESNGESQCKLITGSTASLRRFIIQSKRPANTVFSHYLIRVGLKKLSQAGLIYSGGVIENALLGLYQYVSVEKLRFVRLPTGEFYVYLTTPNAYWTDKAFGGFRLTSGIAYASSTDNLLTGNTIAPSGKTYKFTLRLLESLTFTASTELSFIIKDTNGTELAKITALSSGALGSDIDANGVGEKTFTASTPVDMVYLYFNNTKLSDQKMHFALSLTEVTT